MDATGDTAMTDRELLELAAKAAGKDIDPDRYDEDDGFAIKDMAHWWNPLTNDGHALRLAYVLKIDIEWQNVGSLPTPYVEAYCRDSADAFGCFCPSEPEADYRRAIVRVAAEIGKALP